MPGVSSAMLEILSRKLYGAAMDELNTRDASALIDVLKEIRAGQLDLESLLDGEER